MSRSLVNWVRIYRVLRPFRHRDFRLLWGALAVSLVGDGIWLVAIPWQVISLGAGPIALATVVAAGSLGILTSLFFGGVLADAVPRRSVLYVSSTMSFVVVSVLVFFALFDSLTVGPMAAAAFILAALDGIAGPSAEALLPTLLPEDEVQAANGLESFLSSVAARAIGPAIGGAIVVLMGPVGALIIDAMSFLVAGFMFLFLRGGRSPAAPETASFELGSMAKNFRDGAVFVAHNRWLWCGIGWASLALLAQMGPRQVLLPFLVANDLKGAASDFGLLLAAYGVAATAGALLAASITVPRRYLTYLFLVWSIGSLPFAMLPFAPNFALALFVMAIAGLFLSMGNVLWSTLLQRRVSDELRGRVSSFDWFGSLALLPLSMAIAGSLGSAGAARAAFVAAGLVPPVLAVAALFAAGLRRDEEQHPLTSTDAAEARR